MPRDVEQSVGDLESVYLYNLDDLKRVVDRNLRARAGEIPKVEALIEKALGDYMEWYAGHRVREAIRALEAWARVQAAKAQPEAGPVELEKAAGRLAHPFILGLKRRALDRVGGPPCPEDCLLYRLSRT